MATKSGSGKKRVKKVVPVAKVYVQSTYNNTIVTVTDPKGAVIAWSSAGTVGFKGSRKSTPYAAGQAADNAMRKALEHGVQTVDVFYRGPGSGKDSAVRMIQQSRVKVGTIKDLTSAPHNGCRPKKRRRV